MGGLVGWQPRKETTATTHAVFPWPPLAATSSNEQTEPPASAPKALPNNQLHLPPRATVPHLWYIIVGREGASTERGHTPWRQPGDSPRGARGSSRPPRDSWGIRRRVPRAGWVGSCPRDARCAPRDRHPGNISRLLPSWQPAHRTWLDRSPRSWPLFPNEWELTNLCF